MNHGIRGFSTRFPIVNVTELLFERKCVCVCGIFRKSLRFEFEFFSALDVSRDLKFRYLSLEMFLTFSW